MMEAALPRVDAIRVVARLAAAVLVVGLLAAYLDRAGPRMLTVTADFDRAGLNVRVGDEVRVRDLPVGKITSITVDRAHGFSARYRLAVAPSARVAAGTTARVVPKTLFGDEYVALDEAAPGAPTISDGAVIPPGRTSPVLELTDVLDRLTPVLASIDPVQIGGTIAAFSAGLGNGTDLGRVSSGFGTTFRTIADRQADVDRLLASGASLAATMSANTGNLTAMARNFGALGSALAADAPTLATFLSSNAALLQQAGGLLQANGPELQKLTADGLDVLALVAQYPGRLHAFLAGTASYEKGLVASTHGGTLLAYIPNLFVDFPVIQAAGGNAGGGPSLGPEVNVKAPVPPQTTIDLSPLTGPVGGQGSDASGLGALLGRVSGGTP